MKLDVIKSVAVGGLPYRISLRGLKPLTHGAFLTGFATCCFLLSSYLISCSSVDRTIKESRANRYYALSLESLREDDIQNALVEIKKAIEIKSSDKKYFNILGYIHMRMEDYENAEEALNKAIIIDPNYSEAHNNLGVTYTKSMLWDKSIEAFKKALENPLYKSPESAYSNLGISLYRLGKYKEAIREFGNALRIAPESYRPFYGLALSYNAIRQYGYAGEALSKAIKLDPFFKGDLDMAQNEFSKRKQIATGAEKKDFVDYLDILYY